MAEPMTDHPITPPPELVASLRNSAPHGIRDTGVTREFWLINKAYAAGADQELEATLQLMETLHNGGADYIRTARRPKPPSLKKQALEALEALPTPAGQVTADRFDIIRRAPETLND